MTTDATTVVTPPQARIAWQRFGLLLQTNLLLYLRNRMAVFWNMVFPIGLMLLFGAIYGKEPAAITYLATGMVVLSLLSNGLIGNAATMALWRERGILRRIQTTPLPLWQDRKSTRLNSSHMSISYAVFCLKKKNNNYNNLNTQLT